MAAREANPKPQVHVEGISRAAFLMSGALAAGALYGIASVGPFVSDAFAQAGGGDRAIVEFALMLERLESTYYQTAVKQVPGLSADVRSVIVTIRDDEVQHARVLTDLDQQFAGTPGPVPKFTFGDAFSSQARFLEVAQMFEDTGVAAYNGAGPQLQSKPVLQAAGMIVQVEARHAAVIRSLRGQPIAPAPFDAGQTQQQVAAKVKPYVPAASAP